jgi:hypothetical protein
VRPGRGGVGRLRPALDVRRRIVDARCVVPMPDLTSAVVVFCLLVAAVFLGLWLYYDRRDHARFELERRKTTFHCIRCDALYTAPAGTELAKCPRCAYENTRLKF